MVRIKSIVLVSSLVLSFGLWADPLDAQEEKQLEWLYRGKPLDDWLAELENDAEAGRKDAVEALPRFLQDQRGQIELALLGMLGDPSPVVRGAAVRALAWSSPRLEASEAMVRAVRDRLTDPDEDRQVREDAARRLNNLGIAGANALAAARNQIEDTELRRTLIVQLSRMPHDLRDVIEDFPAVRAAFEQMAQQQRRPKWDGPEKTAWMRAALERVKQPEVRQNALEYLLTADQIEDIVVEQLILEIKERGAPSDSRAGAMLRLALSYSHKDAAGALPALSTALESGDDQLRYLAGIALVAISPKGEIGDRAIDSLVDYFVKEIQKRNGVGEEIGWTFQFATVKNSRRDELFRRIMARLDDDQAGKVRHVQFDILRELDQLSVTLLIPLLQHKDWGLRQDVALALGAFGPAPATEASAPLSKVLENPEEDPRVISAAMAALAKIDPEAKSLPPIRTDTLLRLARTESRLRHHPWLVTRLRKRSHEVIQRLVNQLEELPAKPIKLEPGAGIGDSPDNPAGQICEILVHMGEPAVPELHRLAINYAADWRGYDTARALARIGRAGVGVLVELTTDEVPAVRRRAVRALTGVAPRQPQVTKVLIAATRDPDSRVSREAVIAISRMTDVAPDVVMPVLIEHLHHKDWDVARDAADALRHVGRARPEAAVAAYREALRRDGWKLTWGILDALPEFGEAATAALPEIRLIIEQEKKQHKALETVAAMGPGAKQVEDLLLAELESPHPLRRFWAAVALSRFDSGVHAVLPVLIDFVRVGGRRQDRIYNLRVLAAEAIGQIGPAAEPAIDPLVEVLRKRPQFQRPRSVKRRQSGDLEEGAMEEQNDSRDTYKVMVAAAEALGRIGQRPETVVPALTDTIELTNNGTLPAWAATALRHFGPDAAPAAGALVRSIEYRTHAETLLAIGKPAVPVVAAVLQDDRRAQPAAELLGKMGPTASAAVPALLNVVRDRAKHFRLREAAIRALGQIGSAARPVVPYLEALSSTDVNSDWTNRQRAQAAREALDRIRSSEGAAASEDCVSNRQVNRCVKPAPRLTASRRHRRVRNTVACGLPLNDG